jgi:pSer/pThr/pTyr-binding forkhead associated (FHA) protein
MPPEAPPAQQWGAPTVISPAPDFNAPPPASPMPPTWGAPTVVTPAQPQQGVPPPQQQWGAPTVVTPAPDFGSQPPAAPPMPSAWGAPTQPSDAGVNSYGNPPPQDQRYIPTVVGNPQEMTAYPETILTEPAPTAPTAPTAPPAEEVSTAQTPRLSDPTPDPLPVPSGSGTADISRPAPPPAAPGGQSTIVMSSTPIAVPPKQARLLLIMEGGEVGETFGLRPAETVIGRVDGDIKFPHDGYMSSRHARILQRNGRFFLIDNNSRNGTFVKIHQEVELHPGDVILVGKQLFRFETEEE